MDKFADHKERLTALRRIEGQVRGIQKMIEDGKYCVDILTQVHAAMSALAAVENGILEAHLRHCVKKTLRSGSAPEKDRKLKEVMGIITKYRKLS